MKAALISFAFLIVLFSPRVATACSCAGRPSICESFAAAEAVLVGTVARVENDGRKGENGRVYITGQTAYVQVEESFKGARVSEMVFRSYGSSCDAVYKEGQRWLFYASFDKEDKAWSIGGCGRSTLIEWAADDLLYLRNLPASAQKTRISGMLRSGTDKPLMGIKVKFTDGQKVYDTFTDKNGVYEVFGLPPGKYLVEPEIPVNLKINFPSYAGEVDYSNRKTPRVLLKEKSCAGASFYFTENTFISGKVFSPDGRPLKNVCLRLRSKDNPDAKNFLMDCTEADGTFKIDEIPLGDYLLIANEDGVVSSFQPFRTVYYPGVFEKEKATVLTIASGDQRRDTDLHIPSLRPTRTVEGTLVYSDGRPVADESVQFTGDAQQGASREEVNVRTDSNGRFSLPVLEGLKGSLRGYKYTYRGQYKNCPQLEKLIKGEGQTSAQLETNVIKLEINRDHRDLELKFPFPYCEKSSEPQ